MKRMNQAVTLCHIFICILALIVFARSRSLVYIHRDVAAFYLAGNNTPCAFRLHPSTVVGLILFMQMSTPPCVRFLVFPHFTIFQYWAKKMPFFTMLAQTLKDCAQWWIVARKAFSRGTSAVDSSFLPNNLRQPHLIVNVQREKKKC